LAIYIVRSAVWDPGPRSPILKLDRSGPRSRREEDPTMKRFLIEREIPGVGSLDAKGLRDAARTSNQALAKLGPDVQWVESYVVADKTYCVYLATDEEVIREHARISGFPANRISEIKTTIDPTTAGD
jgi:Protein of unknown function (DUF4242)